MTTDRQDLPRPVKHRLVSIAAEMRIVGTRFARHIVLFASVMVVPCSGFAHVHEMEQPREATPTASAIRACQTKGVRAAWGAQARFLGAPATFKYIPEAPLRKMFMGDIADIRADAIYVLDELETEERRDYEESAFYGWTQADRWLADGRERPEYEVLVALFYQGCKEDLMRSDGK